MIRNLGNLRLLKYDMTQPNHGKKNSHSVTLLLGKQGAQNLRFHLTLFKPGRQIMPTTLLLVHPDLEI